MPTKHGLRVPSTSRTRRSDLFRALLACIVLAAVLGLAAFVGTGWQQATRVVSLPTESEALATGPMLFIPAEGNRCRKRVIDNATWHIRDEGEVDCTTALSGDAHGGGSATRVEIIRKAFRAR